MMPSLPQVARQSRGTWTCLVAAGLAAGHHPSAAAPQPDWVRETIEATDIGSLALSPDEKLLAFRTSRPDIERNRYEWRWQIVDLASGQGKDIASAGEAIIRDPGVLIDEPPTWSPDGQWIYYRALRDGQVQLWGSAVHGFATEQVTTEDGDVETAEAATGEDGIRFGVGPDRARIERAETDEYGRGILIDAHVDLAQNLFRGAIVNGRSRSQRLTGRWFERGGILWDIPLRHRLLRFGSHRISDIDPEEARDPLAEGLTARSASGEVATAAREGGRAIISVVASAGDILACRASPCRSERISWMQWRPGHRQLLFASSDRAHAQTLWNWDLDSGRVALVARTNGLASGGRSDELSCAVTESQAICVTAEARAPPRLEAINLENGKRRILFDPNQLLRRHRWPKIERLQWKDAESRIFTATMFLAHGSKGARHPLFINYYRCEGFIRGGVGDEWPFAALAEAGIVSVCINATRTDGPQDGVGRYRAALSGIETLVARLERRGLIDPARVGIGGLSFGSEVAMWAVIHSNLIAAVSVASPQFEPASYWFNAVRGRDYRETLNKVWGLGEPDETAGQWKLVSPALNTSSIRAPLLMQLSEQEARYAVELRSRLANSTTPFELYAFPDEPHIKVQPRHRLATYQRNLDWFRFWLMGREDHHPAKAEQYGRWRDLKARADQGSSAPAAKPELE